MLPTAAIRLAAVCLVFAAPAAHAAFSGPPLLVVGSAISAPGQQAAITVSLLTGGAVVATQNDLLFDATRTPVAVTESGKPDCTVNPTIRKGAATFAFQPYGCSPPACNTVRAVVYSLDNYEPIPNGALVYSCRLRVAADADPGVYPLEAANIVLSDPLGERIDGADAVHGQIVVPGIAPPATFSPSPTPSPSASIAPTHTPSPTQTPPPPAGATASPTASPTASRSASRTRTPSLTRTPTHTHTPTQTRTPTPSPTATASRTPTATRTPTPTRTASDTPTRTATSAARPSSTPTHTATAVPTASPTASPTSTPTAAATATSTLSPTPTVPPVFIAAGSARGIPGGSVRIGVRLRSAPFATVATANDLTLRSGLFAVEPGDCTLAPGLDKSLLVSILPPNAEAERLTLRAFVRTVGAASVVPDGEVYACRVRILASTPPGVYPVANTQGAVFDVTGLPYEHVETTSGNIVVSLVTPCAADCDYDGEVTVDELLVAVNAVLGQGGTGACAAADADGDAAVTVEDVVAAVNAALHGCPRTGDQAPAPAALEG